MISLKLRLKDVFQRSPYISVDGELFRDVAIGLPIVFRGSSRGVSGIVVTENGQVIGSGSVSRLTHRWKVILESPNSYVTVRRIFFETFGLDGQRLFRVERNIRVIPSRYLVLKRRDVFWDFTSRFHWAWNFKFGNAVATYMLSETPDSSGWNVLDQSKLVIADGIHCMSFSKKRRLT